ncbi:TRM11 family SAM-dependent methyltransferase [Virgibacillus flavescens]|uniref:TRM11 family SAM-dependent methyltransferase n=1 Tax=Virgibacillus flavescens TaxID=1611422 RepID=UPI003D34272B
MNTNSRSTYIYTYAFPEDERELCSLEMRAFFGEESKSKVLESFVEVDPSRSPFMKERIRVIYEGETFQDLLTQVPNLKLGDATFKVTYVKNVDLAKAEKAVFKERRRVEREIGLHVTGIADLDHPARLFGVMYANGRWVFGDYTKSESIWYQHQKKPHNYSTALSTRDARAIVNIAIPNPSGIKAIDPCCGIGTVLVEAQSMEIDIVGSDLNYLILDGARENIAYFGFTGEIKLADIRDITGHYDVAIIDLPYNLCSVLTADEQLEMLQSARRFAEKVVVITIDPIDDTLLTAGFTIVDRAFAKKGLFTREVLVCK